MNSTGIDANRLAGADATGRPAVPVESGIETLTRFARLASAAGTGSSILPLLADSLVLHTAADAVAVVEIREGGAKFASSPHLPEELRTFEIDSDKIGEELDGLLLAACRGRFAHVRPRPLVSGGGLFGWVVMFFRAPDCHHDFVLADGLVDMAAFEVKETKDSYLFKADVPGIKESDITISLTGNRLTVSGKRDEEKRQENETFFSYERSYGSFTRAFTLPEGVDAEKVSANLKEGVLSIAVPKTPEAQPKRVSIKTG
jgi:HSP20 family molecular chaperone IbpA